MEIHWKGPIKSKLLVEYFGFEVMYMQILKKIMLKVGNIVCHLTLDKRLFF